MANWNCPAFECVARTMISILISVSLLFVVHRIVSHPLPKYPGPLLAKFTNLYAAYHAWKGDIHIDMWRCHLKYGDRVRYGPNRVLINNTLALHDIYGHSAHVKKSDSYKILALKAPNTLTMSDKVQHARRRRIISRAFSENSPRLFEPILISKINIFCLVLRSYLSCKEKYYHTMEESKFRYVIDAIQESNVRLGVIFQAPALTFGRMDRLPKFAASSSILTNFLRQLLTKRLQGDTQSIDIFSFLQQCRDPDTGEGLSPMELSTETATFIVAGRPSLLSASLTRLHFTLPTGSDTTATTMAAVSYYLCKSVDEIRLGPTLNSCVFLRACIDEALRFSPLGGASLWRQVQTGGMYVGNDFIPEGCEVGIGRSCVGKPLSLAQIMLTFARLLWEFDFRSKGCVECQERDDHTDGIQTEYTLKDHILGQGRGPETCFQPRF
ncbi:cytochrome P450 [Hypoxylon sp. NC0597]|nr:cytochrome P450 [Hypoxylon sp. NC0597]